MATFNHAKSSLRPVAPSLNTKRSKIESHHQALMQNEQSPVFIKYSLMFLGFLALFYFVPPSLPLVYIGLCLWALVGAKQSLQAITFAVFIRYLNPALFTLTAEVGILSWLILLLAAIRNILFMNSSVVPKILPILLFALLTAALTFITSSFVMVSLMKLFSFTVGAVTVLVCCDRLQKNEIQQLWIWICALFSVVIFLSLFTFLNPAVAYHRGAGFQGILNHPQSLGALIAPFTCWLLAGVFFQKRSLISLSVLVSLLLVSVSIFSETRTSMVAVALSLICSLLLFLKSHQRYFLLGSINKTMMKGAVFLLLFITLVALYKPAQNVIFSYVFKRDSANIEEAISSRSGGIEGQWQNFLKKPIAGWGFGVYPGNTFSKDVHTFMGIPISAPVEKGFIPTALLEEVGVMGAFIFVYLIWSLTKFVVVTPDIRWASLYFSCLFVNLGESVFFSAGGIGIFYWVLIGLSTVAYKMKPKKEK